MTNRILSTGRGIFTLSLHTRPWDLGRIRARWARRAKRPARLVTWRSGRMIVRKRASSSSASSSSSSCRDSSCRDSRRVTPRKEGSRCASRPGAHRLYVGHVSQRRVITFTLFHKTSKAAPRLIDARRQRPSAPVEHAKAVFLLGAICRELKFNDRDALSAPTEK